MWSRKWVQKNVLKKEISCNILISVKQTDLDLKIFHTSVVRLVLKFYLVYCDWLEISDVTEKYY